jgi:hypothetical protein
MNETAALEALCGWLERVPPAERPAALAGLIEQVGDALDQCATCLAWDTYAALAGLDDDRDGIAAGEVC